MSEATPTELRLQVIMSDARLHLGRSLHLRRGGLPLPQPRCMAVDPGLAPHTGRCPCSHVSVAPEEVGPVQTHPPFSLNLSMKPSTPSCPLACRQLQGASVFLILGAGWCWAGVYRRRECRRQQASTAEFFFVCAPKGCACANAAGKHSCSLCALMACERTPIERCLC